jgi:hypothetical protein
MPEAHAGAADYAAFLSYSRDDRAVCERVHRGLESLSRPFFRLRGRRVFRDTDYLAAAASLERVLRQALSRSEYFVLLASRHAARSFWVDFESRNWLSDHEGRQRKVLILLCDGDIVWNTAAGDFDWTRTTALPPAFKRAFDSEPLYCDLRGVIADGQPLTLRRTAFRDRLAEIVAPLDGRSKDEIVGRHVAVRRRLVTAAIVIGLGVALLGGGLLNRTTEVRRQRAIDGARQLLSRSADVVAAEGDPDHWAGALRVAVADAQGAVRELGRRLPALAQADEIYMRALLGGLPGRVTRIPLEKTSGGWVSDDGRRVAVAVDGGDTMVLWDLAAGREVARIPKTLLFSRDLRAFAWSEDHHRIALDVGGTRVVAAEHASRTLTPLAIARGGLLAYVERSPSAAGGSLLLVAPGRPAAPLCQADSTTIAQFSPDETRVAATCADGVHAWAVDAGRPSPARPIARLAVPRERAVGLAFDAAGTQLALGTTRRVRLWGLEDPPRLLAEHQVIAPDDDDDSDSLVSAIGLAPGGGRIAVTIGDGVIACLDAASGRTIFPAIARWQFDERGRYRPDLLSRIAAQRPAPGGLTLFDTCAPARLGRLVLGSEIEGAVVNETARRAVVLDKKGGTFVADLRPASVDAEDTIPGEVRLAAIAERAPVQALATASRLWAWDVEKGTRLLDESGSYAGAHAALSQDGGTLAVVAGTTLTVWRCLRGGACAAGPDARPLPLTATVANEAGVAVTAEHVVVFEPDGPALLRITADALEPGVLPAGLRPVLLDTGPKGVSRLLLVDRAGTRLVTAEVQGEVVANQAVVASGRDGDFTPAREYARPPGSDAVLVVDDAGGRLVSGGRGGAPGTSVAWTLRKREAPLRAISDDARFLAVATSVSRTVPEPIDADQIEIVDLRTGRVVTRLPLPTHVAAMRFGPGGHFAVAANAVAAGDAGFRLRVYDPGTWRAITDMQLPSRPEYVTFGPGGAVVAAGLRDGTTSVVNRAGVRVLIAPQRGRVVYCAFVDGGRKLASIGSETNATTLQIGPASRAALADRLLQLQAFVP